MSHFTCPNCGHESHIFSRGGARREAETLGMEFLGELPLDIEIRETSDGGRPIVVSKPDSPHAMVYVAIARRVWERVSAALDSTAAQGPRIVMQ
jgi:ATP-binding protein involved in chromosome partitioning